MVEVKLTIYSATDSREFQMTGDQVSLGRGDVTLKLNDDGLSRLHATIYRDGDRVWILDEGSTNGTSVNGAFVPPAGLPLKDGDEIAVGNDTAIAVRIFKIHTVGSVTTKTSWWADNHHLVKYWPLAAVLAAVTVTLIAAFALGNIGRDDKETAENRTPIHQGSSPAPTNQASNPPIVNLPTPSPFSSPSILSEPSVQTSPTAPPLVKTYLAMSEAEKKIFIQSQAEQIARVIGNRSGEAVTPEALLAMKSFVDAFASRAKRPRLNAECYIGNWLKFDLTTTLERGRKNAPFIIRAFNQKGLDPQLGLYLAYIESEYCDCLQSPTGPLGMFQFATATAQTFGLKAVRGSSPSHPDERCQPEAAAGAAAGYIKFLMLRYGTGPLSVPLAIASYNSGEGALSNNLSTAMTSAMQEERSFWTLVANKGKLSSQFQKENIRYVPKFFAAAIVGENPQTFGVPLQPLSSYTQ
jgi:pSer/pThr/pTyr-binding forkhead associated (FHA) protein/soluble lytic murein transglycosylase-like protein